MRARSMSIDIMISDPGKTLLRHSCSVTVSFSLSLSIIKYCRSNTLSLPGLSSNSLRRNVSNNYAALEWS